MADPFWRTALSSVEKNKIMIRGYRVEDLMENCTFGDMVYLTFRGELPSGYEGRLIEMMLVSSTDHSVLAPSIDATRFVASGGVPLQAAVAAGVLALGEHHGGAIEQCAKVLQESVASKVSAADIARNFRERKQRFPGVGHPLHSRDPRPVVIAAAARRWNLAGPHLELIEAIAEEIKLPMNIDGGIAGIMSDIGIDWRYGKTFFILSRTLGLAAHAVEETTRERPFRSIDLKDVAYDGPAERDMPEGFKKPL